MMRDKMKPGGLKSEQYQAIDMTILYNTLACVTVNMIYIASSASCIEIMSDVKCDIKRKVMRCIMSK